MRKKFTCSVFIERLLFHDVLDYGKLLNGEDLERKEPKVLDGRTRRLSRKGQVGPYYSSGATILCNSY